MRGPINCTVVYPSPENMVKLKRDLAMTMFAIAEKQLGSETLDRAMEELKKQIAEKNK